MSNTIKVANVLLQNEKDQVLLLQRSPRLTGPYLWGLPGGIVDEKELVLEAGYRELREETGIRRGDTLFRSMGQFIVTSPDEKIILSLLRLQLTSKPVIEVDPDEHVNDIWIDPERIYSANDLLPGLPTIVALTLGAQNIQDRTISQGTTVVQAH